MMSLNLRDLGEPICRVTRMRRRMLNHPQRAMMLLLMLVLLNLRRLLLVLLQMLLLGVLELLKSIWPACGVWIESTHVFWDKL